MDVQEQTRKVDGVADAPVQAARRRKSLIREYGEAIVIAILLALVIRTLVVQAFTIPSGSMMDTLLVGDYILVNKFLYGPEIPFTEVRLPGLRAPHRGDIIVFKYPQDEKRDFIKRIVGTPGDAVQIRGNDVYVNGQKLIEPYTKHTSPSVHGGQAYCGYAYGCEPTTVPAGSYFVMGDNRDNSQDSRYWGFVRRDRIKGKAFLIYWSWDSDRHWLRWWGRLGNIFRDSEGGFAPLPTLVARLRLAPHCLPPAAGLRGRSPRSNAVNLMREPAMDVRLVSSPLGVLAEVTPTNRSVGVYVHVPFCTRRCEYCSFNTAPVSDRDVVSRFLAALLTEIELLGGVAWARGVRVETIFLGGGTPSLLEAAEMAGVLEALGRTFVVDDDAEVTVECNPESVTREKLGGYRDGGVNRISLGVQSLDDAILPAIGRLHTAAEARRAFEAARGAGFSNVSVDLIYGLPGLTAESWRSTVNGVLSWEPEHLSAYGLTLDPGSIWGSTGIAGLPPEEAVIAHYWTMTERAAANGYEHYEISNYARPGRRSRHNQIYWRRGEYLAFGPGAAGFIADCRYTNVKPVTRYTQLLEAARLPIDTFERLNDHQALAETLILGLRTTDGVDRSVLAARVAHDPALRRRIAAWRDQGLLEDAGSRTRLTESGFLLSDALFVELL